MRSQDGTHTSKKSRKTLVITILVLLIIIGIGVGVIWWFNGGGFETIMNTIRVHNPGALEPFGGGSMPASLYFTQWLLVWS